MTGILLDQPAPGATTCIVIGVLPKKVFRDFSSFRAVLHCIDPSVSADCHPALPLGRTQIVRVGTDSAEPTLERFVRLDPRHLPSLIVTHAIAGSQAENYQRLIAETHRLLESTHRTRFTRQQDGFNWQRHILQNAAAYARHRVPSEWAGALRGIPAFICGAGPSLDVSIGKLATAADGAVVFSADSALRALARHHIRADFAVSIDQAKIPAKCLPGDPAFSPHRVVLASVSPPAWQEALPAERRFFLSSNQLTDDWFANQGVARTEISATESCGSTAIDLAHFLGCDPIYLFGLDLAVDPANQARRHQADADPALYTASRYDPAARLPKVPGNYEETVPCFALGDWQELDARLHARSGSTVFNVNDRGARLRGTILVHPDRFTFEAPAASQGKRLTALAEANGSTASVALALARLRDCGHRCEQALPVLGLAFDQRGPAALAEAFRPLLLDPEIGRALGAFALKAIPHLIPPIEGDLASWQTLLDEFAELSRLARAAG